ncbi:MAG: hypothetical protein HOM14_14780 [Gammaproteobacteria bacterium]|jgi:hypothetical protein|nr:hypothetical protein [Gammaproteobacteria bacterium]MBT3725663.1 hypothetical protein [Gammaproteobacteria bacterium]MBT4075461.1 hypothetical protein [Gammaproteobacteria bacterium]MBT4195691.1 hypothetical protein [Gammaproteobacteria bacterium]MBT4449169.1 hypothetical protein [Gammaproteobacteria bacterium]
MSNEADIPLLKDLLFRGQPEAEEIKTSYSSDEHKDFEIEQDESDSEIIDEEEIIHQEETDEPVTEETPQEGLPDEINSTNEKQVGDDDIRLILEKHMENAYAEIKQLLKDKTS